MRAGRISAILLGLALTVSCASTDVGITGMVKAKLAADDTVRASEVQVTTNDRVVTLTGNIDSAMAKDRALRLARETKGVLDVVDMIEVRTSDITGEAPTANRTIGETIDDAGITMRVKGRLLDDPVVQGLKIDVDTREGVVYLTGVVQSQEVKKKAVQLARETQGVRDVRENLEIRS